MRGCVARNAFRVYPAQIGTVTNEAKMPTLTRLAALILFGVAVFYASTQYHLLYDEPPRSGAGHLFLSITGAFVGWSFVGKRLTAELVRNFTVVIQGFIAGLILALILFGFYDAFTQGYAMRYKNLEDALQGFFRQAAEHLQRMADTSFLLLLLALALGMSLVLTFIFRLAEARRQDR
jgi:hypothetical protein